MAINRVLYATQTVRLNTGSNWYSLPAQTASADETIPQDDVLVLGKLGGVARLQKDVATCKASVKLYLCDDVTLDTTGANLNALGTPVVGEIDQMGGTTGMLTRLEADALAGNNIFLYVDSQGLASAAANLDGFYMTGIASSIGIDASKGAFPMIDIAFEGVGRLEVLNMGTSATLSAQAGGDWHVSAATPLTSQQVSITGVTTDTIANVKLSYDMPTETLSRLGGAILGKSTVVGGDNQMFSKPPFKASATADGQSAAQIASVWTGSCNVLFDGSSANLNVSIQSAGLNVSTKSFSQNVGDVGATFSVTAEGTKMFFAL